MKSILSKQQIAFIAMILGMLGFLFLEGALLKGLSITAFVIGGVIMMSE